MTATKLQATQTVLDDVLSEIGNSSREQLNLILDKFNTALKIPGLLSCTGSDKVISVGNTTLTLPNGKKETLTLGDTDIGGLSGSVDFATGTGSGDVQTVSLPSMTSGYWVKAGFEIRSDKKIYVVFGTEGSTEVLATFPDWSAVSYPLGYVSLHDNGSGAFLNTSNSYIYQIKPAPALLLDHTLLANKDSASQHPTTSISTTTGQFSGELSSSEDESQKAFVRLEQYGSIFDWATGKAYRVGNVIKYSGTIYRCTTAHTAGGAFDGAKFELVLSAQDHNTLANKDAASQHPSSSIYPSVTNFTDFLRSTEDTDQKVFDRIDDYSSIRAYSASLTYRINNVVTQSGSLWRCTSDGATGSFNEANWSLLVSAPVEELQTVAVDKTVFTLSTITIPTASSKLMVFVNGVYQVKDTHYTVDSSTQITFSSTVSVGAQVLFRL